VRFAEAVAARASRSLDEVEATLAEYGVEPQPTAAAPVDLTVTRLRFSGTKSGENHHGEPIDFDQNFEPGLWAVVSEQRNLVGKSSVLFLMRWALTGRSSLTPEVRSWITHVHLEGVVGGESFRVTFDIDGPEIAGELTSASGSERFDAQSFEEVMDGYFLDRLRLQPMPVWQRRPGQDDEGDRRRLGWPAYFPALHLLAESNRQLLGDQAQGGQPTALMQVFLGLPWSQTQASARVALNEVQMRMSAGIRRVAEDEEAREAVLAPTRDRLSECQRALAELEKQDRIPAYEVDRRTADYTAALSDLRGAEEAASLARRAQVETERDADEAQKRVDAVLQSQIVKPLLGRLSPTACPRCYASIGTERIARESEHHCSVCDEPLEETPSDEDQLNDAKTQLTEAEARDGSAQVEVRLADKHLAESRKKFERADRQVREAEEVRPIEEQAHALEKEIANLEGRLVPVVTTADEDGEELEAARQVLSKAKAEAEARRKVAADDLLADLGTEVGALARRFGIPNLEDARPKLNAQLQVRVGGTLSNFGDRPPGEQIRLRLATVVALLRIGAKRGVGRHPGLLLVDSPGAEEMVDQNVSSILDELSSICKELDGLQLICATARAHEAKRAVNPKRLVHGPDYAEVW
jgi:hypothetical protein